MLLSRARLQSEGNRKAAQQRDRSRARRGAAPAAAGTRQQPQDTKNLSTAQPRPPHNKSHLKTKRRQTEGDWRETKPEQALCSSFHSELQPPRQVFMDCSPRSLPGPVRGAAALIAFSCSLREVCAAELCFAYKELPEEATFSRSQMKACRSRQCEKVPG